MAYIIKIHNSGDDSVKIKDQILKFAEEFDFIDVYEEQIETSEIMSEIETKLNDLKMNNIELLKDLAKHELIRRKMNYKRLSEIPLPFAGYNMSERLSLFSIENENKIG